MTRSVLNAQSVVSWHSTKTESRAQYCLFVTVSFIISHCKRNFPLDPYQCLRNFFLVRAPCAVVQSKAHCLQFRCCFMCMSPSTLSPCSRYGELPWFSPNALVETQPRHAVGNIWSCGGKNTTTRTHNRKPCWVATTQACLLYPDEMKLSQPC